MAANPAQPTIQPAEPDRLTPVKMLAVLAVSAIAIALAYMISETPFDSEGTLNRWISLVIGGIIVYAIYLATARSPIWKITINRVIYAAIGASLYGLLLWFGNTSSIFAIPSASQVVLRPAIVIPIWFGYTFGPVTGFLTGLIGNVIGDLLPGFGVSPQWDLANGLIGLIAGLPLMFPSVTRQQRTWVALGLSGVLAVLASIMFMFNQSTPNQFIFSDTPIAVSAVLGMTPIIGVAIIVGAYLAFVLSRPDAALAVVWGGLGNMVGIAFAALADIYVNGYSLPVAIVGEFIPAAGPNMITLAILVPILVSLTVMIRKRGLQPRPG